MKYNCRECSIRIRCIDQSSTSPSVKVMIYEAFTGRTDTEETWRLLQMHCLLRQQEQLEKLPRRESLLMQRLRRSREGESAQVEKEAAEDLAHPARPAVPATSPPADVMPTVVGQRGRREEPAVEDASRPFLFERAEAQTVEQLDTPHRPFLVTVGTGRRIALPDEGELILGRFDPDIGLSPDIDLSFEDRGAPSVSRRHARLTASRGTHFIEDLGSSNDTWINGQRLRLGHRIQLAPGDHLLIGNCRLKYTLIPEQLLLPGGSGIRAFLLVLATDHRFDLPASGQCIVGRADPELRFSPDVDLGREGRVSSRISRRHVRISWREGQHYVEDLGSLSGTKVKGRRIELGDTVPLAPGDPLWLGGCVLAYDIQSEARTGGA